MALLLTRNDVESLITMEDAIDATEAVVREEVAGTNVHMPPFGGAHAGVSGVSGVLRVVGGGSYGLGFIGVRSGGMAFVYGTAGATPDLLAIVGYPFSTLRVGASLGLGAKYLARPECRTIGLLGAGRNALDTLRGLRAVRPIEQVKVYSPTPEHRVSFARRATAALGIPVMARDSQAEAIDDVDIIALATSSYVPVLMAESIRPGVHVSSMGTPNEVDASVYPRIEQFVVPSRAQELESHAWDPLRPDQPESGLHRLLADGRFKEETIIELGNILVDEVRPKNGPDAITLFRDSRGGVGDLALAHLAYQRARERGLGIEFEF